MEEHFHPVCITCKDNHKILAVVFHDLQENLDRFLSVVAFIIGPIEIIGLVNKQDATHSALEDLFGFWCCVADILAHKIIARYRYEMAFADIAQAMENIRHTQGKGRFTCTGIACEAHMQRRRLMREAHAFARAFDNEQRRDFTQALFDGM